MNVKLQGQFKFDLYETGGKLIESSEFIDNFITNSGVMYPYHFAFADCFRFLSIGNGTQPNSIIKNNGSYPETTGLWSPLTGYSYIGNRPSWASETTNYAEPGNYGAGCGYINNASGVSLIRQWNLPNNSGGYFNSNQTFTEFMVTPGRPYVTGANRQQVCSCNQTTTDDTAIGNDCSSIADYYIWLSQKYGTVNGIKRLITCDATNAFSRVLYNVNVVSGSVLTITYQLNIILDTGVHLTSLSYNNGLSDNNWNYNLNTYSSITQPGVCLINNGIIYNSIAPNNNTRLQHFDYVVADNLVYNFENEYGESFVPPMGAPLEPSNFWLQGNIANQNVIAYVSNDNLQFLVSSSGGKLNNYQNFAPWNMVSTGNLLTTYSYGDIISSGNSSYKYIYSTPSSGNSFSNTTYWQNVGGLNLVYPFSSGTMPFRNDNDKVLSQGQTYWNNYINSFNTRSNSGTYPDINDITQSESMDSITFEAAGTTVAPVFQINYISNNVLSGTRSAQVNYTFTFEEYNNSNPFYIQSLVLAYQDLAYGTAFGQGDTVNQVPFFDVVLSGEVGNVNNLFIPSIESGSNIVDGGTGCVIISGGSTYWPNYNYLTSSSVYPIFNTYLKWQVPCPSGVTGC